MQKLLNDEFSAYFKNDELKYRSYVLNGNVDKIKKLTSLLDLHDIKWGYSKSEKVIGFHYGTQKKGTINAKNAIVIKTDQPKGKMVKTLFETRYQTHQSFNLRYYFMEFTLCIRA